MKRASVVVAALGAALLGCGNVIVDGIGGGTSSTTTSSTSSTTGSPSPTWALLVKDPAPTPCSLNTNANPPGALFLLVANQPITCDQPMPSDIPLDFSLDPDSCPAVAVTQWEVCWALPSSSLVPGGTVDLTYPTSPGHNIEAAANQSKDCSVGQADAHGTLQVDAVDASSVSVTLSVSDFKLPPGIKSTTTVVTSGAYDAVRCF